MTNNGLATIIRKHQKAGRVFREPLIFDEEVVMTIPSLTDLEQFNLEKGQCVFVYTADSEIPLVLGYQNYTI